jgi:lipopolysaccharide biosynthesis glycosyltransferase
MRPRVVPTMMCTDAGYLQHSAVCLASLLANNPELHFQIVIVTRPTEPVDEQKLRHSLARFPNHSLEFHQFTPPADQLLPLNPTAHYTIDTYSRLWVDLFFTKDVDRVLYLDGDIVVVGGIAELWNCDLEGNLLATVDIPGSDRGVTRLGMRHEDGYFNAGMLLIDLDQWRKTAARRRVLDYINANPDRILYDQDALNGCFHGCRKRLDYKWNTIWPFYGGSMKLPLSDAEIERVRREARIIHFNGLSKPWNYLCDHPCRDEYTKYLKMTEWHDFVPADRTLVNRLRKVVSAIMPERLKRPLKMIIYGTLRAYRYSPHQPAGMSE